MTIIGALARIRPGTTPETRQRLDALPGVETFELTDPLRIGLVIEAIDVDAAHAVLERQARSTVGVMGVWPIYVHTESGDLEVDVSTMLSSAFRAGVQE